MSSTSITLPEIVPLLPVAGALVLPRGKLPLKILTKPFLQMIDTAQKANRLIGVIQPKSLEEGQNGLLFEVGSLCFIEKIRQQPKGPLHIEVKGLLRFRIKQEVASNTGYRQAQVDYGGFLDDLKPVEAMVGGASHRLLKGFEDYIKYQGLGLDAQSFEKFDSDMLMTTLPNLCKFNMAEKQALLESDNSLTRFSLLLQLFEFGALQNDTGIRQ